MHGGLVVSEKQGLEPYMSYCAHIFVCENRKSTNWKWGSLFLIFLVNAELSVLGMRENTPRLLHVCRRLYGAFTEDVMCPRECSGNYCWCVR